MAAIPPHFTPGQKSVIRPHFSTPVSFQELSIGKEAISYIKTLKTPVQACVLPKFGTVWAARLLRSIQVRGSLEKGWKIFLHRQYQ